jgi:hypothetical protein
MEYNKNMTVQGKGGQPKLEYIPEVGDAICEMLAMGWSLRTVKAKGKDETGFDIPALSTIFKWIRDNDEFAKQYARAKQEAADAMADELLDIVDDGSNDWMEINKGGYTATVVDNEAVQRSKLRAETRKWLMSKMKPKRYGDKLDLTSAGKRIETTPVIVSEIKSRKENASDDINDDEKDE